MAELRSDSSNSSGSGDGDLPLKLEPDSRPAPEQSEQFNFTDGPDGGTEALIHRLLARFEILESQIATCVENQPLLYQVFGKCNVLEQRLKAMKKDVDGRLLELENGSVHSPHVPSSQASETVPERNDPEQTDTHFDSSSGGSDMEWEPDLEIENDGVASDSRSAPVCPETPEGDTLTRSRNSLKTDTRAKNKSVTKPFSCKFCPNSQSAVFKDAESLAVHYTSTHPLPDNDTPEHGPHSSRVTRSLTAAPDPSVPRTDRTCNKCHKIFATPSKLDDHLRTAHHNSHECAICQATFSLKKEMVAHKLEAHGESEKQKARPNQQVPCPDACARSFENEIRAKGHLIACRGLKPHKCSRCGKKYGYIRGLRCHLAAVHGEGSGERINPRVICCECGRSVVRSHLQSHMETHAPREERQLHYCDQCGVGFLNQSDLRLHMRNHAEPDKPRLQCELCIKTFKNSKNLHEHMLLHTERGRYICDECGWAFRRPYLLRSHKESHAKGKVRKKRLRTHLSSR